MPVNYTCPRCGTAFSAKPSKRRRFCSPACHYASRRDALSPDRLWSKLDQSGGPDACWPFMGGRTVDGYGQIAIVDEDGERRVVYTHRLALELTSGPLPPNIQARHSCDNPPCGNPRHLFPGSHAENMRDMQSRGRAFRAMGECSGRVRLSEAQVLTIRDRYDAGDHGIEQIATDYGVSKGAINGVVHRRTWKHI